MIAGFTVQESNGPVEGHITKLKLLKRTMYGRAGFPLLRQRVFHALQGLFLLKTKAAHLRSRKEKPIIAASGSVVWSLCEPHLAGAAARCPMQEHEYEMTIIVSNAHATDFTLVLEPWGRSYAMPPQASYTIVFRSLVPPQPPNTVEVVYGTDQIAVYGWVGCLLAVYHHGEVLPPGAS